MTGRDKEEEWKRRRPGIWEDRKRVKKERILGGRGKREVKERIRGRTAKTKGHLRDHRKKQEHYKVMQ